MKNPLYDHGFGDTWNDIHIHENKGYNTSVSDFHEHDFYEINIIITGDVKILLNDRSEECSGSCLVLTAPDTPHFVSIQKEILYSRLYILFSRDFVENHIPEWGMLLEIFKKNGNIITTTPDKVDELKNISARIKAENDIFRKRLLLFYLLSYISELDFLNNPLMKHKPAPGYIIEALEFIDQNFRKKLTADMIAKELHTGRTTLMTSFKKYTGSTLGNYITHRRLKEAIILLRKGYTEQESAYLCGLSDSGNLIRIFKTLKGTTPKQYIMNHNKKQ